MLRQKNNIKKQHAKTVEEFYQLTHDITNRNIKEISGAQYERYFKQAKSFIDEIMPLVKNTKIY